MQFWIWNLIYSGYANCISDRNSYPNSAAIYYSQKEKGSFVSRQGDVGYNTSRITVRKAAGSTFCK